MTENVTGREFGGYGEAHEDKNNFSFPKIRLFSRSILSPGHCISFKEVPPFFLAGVLDAPKHVGWTTTVLVGKQHGFLN